MRGVMKNPLKILEAHLIKQSQVNGIISEMIDIVKAGTAEHFIEWHNSKATKDRQISPDWYKQYNKECNASKH